jgi:hypothetical protein
MPWSRRGSTATTRSTRTTSRRVQARADDFLASGRDTWLLHFPRGYRFDHATQTLYFEWNPRSPYHSLFERHPAESKTVLSGNHSTFHEVHPTEQDDSLSAWVQVIHGGNLSNQLRAWAPEADLRRLRDFALAPGSLARP